MAGFDKIDFGGKGTVKESIINTSMAKKRRFSIKRLTRKQLGIVGGVLVVLALFLVFGLVLPGLRLANAAKATYAQAKLLSAALKTQNIEVASVELQKTKESLIKTQKEMKTLGYLRFVPIANFYYNDADHLMKAGNEGIETAEIVIEALKPYADVLGLKGQGTFSGGSAEDRIKTAVLSMGKITPKIDEIATKLQDVRSEVDKVNPNHYPEFLFGKKIKTQLASLKLLTDQGVEFVDQARPLIKVLPSLLGESEEKKYLVIFQNDKELRPTGGFITAYAVFRLDKGVIKLDKQDDIYTLDNSISGKERAPEPILKYLANVPVLNIRDSNLSPDFLESMKTFREMYESAGQATDVDGIIAIDTSVLVATIKVLDDQITVNGVTYNTKPDDRCGGCAQVIYELEDNITRPVNYVKTDRKGLLGDMLVALMQKALSSSPSQYWGPLFQTMLTQTNEKHVLFYLYDEQAQSGIIALNAAGQIKPFDGDYLHINEANFSGAKTNLFVEQTVENSYEVKSDGTIIKHLTVEYKNPFPPSNCNLEAGGLCLNAVHRDWFRVYVPKGSTLISSKGSEVKVTTKEDLGKTVFDGFLTVRPGGGKTTLTLDYQLPFKLSDGSVLPLLIQKQPGTAGAEYTIKVNGKTKEKFNLLTDKKLELKI